MTQSYQIERRREKETKLKPENALLFSSPIKEISTLKISKESKSSKHSSTSKESKTCKNSTEQRKEIKLSPKNALLFSSPIKRSSNEIQDLMEEMDIKLSPENENLFKYSLSPERTLPDSEFEEIFLNSFDDFELRTAWNAWSEKGKSSYPKSRKSGYQKEFSRTDISGERYTPLITRFVLNKTYGYEIAKTASSSSSEYSKSSQKDLKSISHLCNSDKVCSPFSCFTTSLNSENEISSSSPTWPTKCSPTGSPGFPSQGREDAITAFYENRVFDGLKQMATTERNQQPKDHSKSSGNRKRKLEETDQSNDRKEKDKNRAKDKHRREKRSEDRKIDGRNGQRKSSKDEKSTKHKHEEKSEDRKEEGSDKPKTSSNDQVKEKSKKKKNSVPIWKRLRLFSD